MKRVLSLIVLFVLIGSLCYAEVEENRVYRVTRVIDGDTFILEDGEHLRLIGIDAPEMRVNAKMARDIRKRHLNEAATLAMGRKSYQFTKKLIEGKKVKLQFDVRKYDDYHRVLAYVYLLDGRFVNGEIVKAGYAYAYPIRPNTHYAAMLSESYNQAKEQHRGLWKKEKGNEKGFKWFDTN